MDVRDQRKPSDLRDVGVKCNHSFLRLKKMRGDNPDYFKSLALSLMFQRGESNWKHDILTHVLQGLEESQMGCCKKLIQEVSSVLEPYNELQLLG